MKKHNALSLLVLYAAAILTLSQRAHALFMRRGRVTGLRLVRSPSGEIVVANLVDGTVVYLNNTAHALTVVATTSGRCPRSVQFGWNTKSAHRTEKSSPYSLCGDKGSRSYNTCTDLAAGSHTVTARISGGNSIKATFTLEPGLAPGSSPIVSPSAPSPLAVSPQPPLPIAPTAPKAAAPMVAPVIVAPRAASPVVTAPGADPASPRAAPLAPRPVAPVPVVVPVVAPTPTVSVPVPTQPVPAPVGTAAPKAPTNAAPTTPTTPPTTEALYINCGGGAFVDVNRNSWMPDTSFTGGSIFSVPSSRPIANTVDDEVYHTSRFGASMRYDIPVVNGIYEIKLFFAETNYTKIGDRVFGVQLETTTIAEIDVVRLSGGSSDQAVIVDAAAVVRDGILTVRFVPIIKDPMIAGLYLLRLGDAPPTKAPTSAPKAPTKAPTKSPTKKPTKAPTKAPTKKPTKAPTKAPVAPTKAPVPVAGPVTKSPTKKPTKSPTKAPTKKPTQAPTKTPTKKPTKTPTKAPTKTPTKAPVAGPTFNPILINCGSTQPFVDSKGRTWLPDQFFVPGADEGVVVTSSASIDGAHPTDIPLYQTARRSKEWNHLRYNIPVPNGEYTVVLHFAELVWNERELRAFNVKFDDDPEKREDIMNLDIFLAVGAKNKALVRTALEVPVDDGFLSIDFDPVANDGLIAGIEVIRIGEHLSHAVFNGPYFAVDTDGDGFASVEVDTKKSHTHGPGNTLNLFVWSKVLGGQQLGTGRKTNLLLPVGETEVKLTITDSSLSIDSDEGIVRVEAIGYPVLFSISPNTGTDEGNTVVTLKGNSIGDATAVRFGPILMTPSQFTVVDAATITFVTPFSGVGVPVKVSVLNNRGESKQVEFKYVKAATINWQDTLLAAIPSPTAVVFGPDGRLYIATQTGLLIRATLNDSYDRIVSNVTAVISTERCILGIAFNPLETPELGDDINVYITTSKIYHGESRSSVGLAINGKVQKVRFSNTNNVEDVVTGLPVSKIDHAINGIYFGNNGELYICVGGNTNAGVVSAKMHNIIDNYFSGAILVANMGRAGFNGIIQYSAENNGDPIAGIGVNGVEIFAAGIRNSYGIVMHSNGQVYCTDNGPQRAFGRRSINCTDFDIGPTEGDKLLRVEKGGFYGYANRKRGESDPRQCTWRSSYDSISTSDYTAPLMPVPSSMNGIIEFESDHFNGEMRGDLIVSQYQEELHRVILSADGKSINRFTSPPVKLTGDGGLAVTQGPDGSLFDARHVPNEVHVIKPVEAASSAMDIKSVFPRRGRLSGNSKLMIFGVNFSGSPTVKIGANACTSVVLVNSKKIECILPAGTVGRHDVAVTIGAVTDTFELGYRYITGQPE